MPTSIEGTIISNGTTQLILKGGQWLPYTAPGAEPFKVGDTDAIGHAWDIIDSINQAKQLSGKPLATGTLSSSITGIPVIGGVVGQNRANLQTKLGAIAGDLRQLGIRSLYQQTGQKGVGSIARNQSEQQALQSSLAPLGFVDQGGGHIVTTGAQPDAATLNQGLNTAQTIYHRHLARLYGLNPDDPATIQMLTQAYGDPALRSTLLRRATAVGGGAPKDNGITPSALPPAIMGGNGEAISTESQATISPALAKIKPQLEQYMASDPNKVSNEAILEYMRQNGVDPSTTDIAKAMQFRVSKDGDTWRARGGNYVVDPKVSTPLTGIHKLLATVAGADPGGVPVGATAVGLGDTYTLGASPDIAGVIHGVTGLGPTREDVVHARNVSAAEHPEATFGGNMAGAFLNPLGRGGGVLRTALLSGAYGAASSDDPSVQARLANAAIASTIGAAVHGAGVGAAKLGTSGYRATRGLVGGEPVADVNALAHAGDKMPTQDVAAAQAELARLRAAGANPPAAAVLDRAGQEFLSRLSSSSPAARTAAGQAAATFRAGVPADLVQSFDQSIAAASPDNPAAAEFLARPTREIAGDVQDMAGREYETGMQPIAQQPLAITPELTDSLTHERIAPAIKEALASHKLDDQTRSFLRSLPGQLKALNINIPGATGDVTSNIRAQYAKGIPMNVDAARNIATALDRTAAKLQPGTEGAVQLRGLSRDIRGEIEGQYPEYGPVNSRYAQRMRSIDAMDAARTGFLGESPEQIDALAKAGGNFTDVPNEPEYGRLSGVEPVGSAQPSNRQFAIAGAREAATTRAGAGTGAGGANLLDQLAAGPNQQARNAMVLGSSAPDFVKQIAAKATVANAIDRITSTQAGDQTAKLWQLAKRALATKLTGGVSHYMVGHALANIPNMTGEDAARVTRIYLNSANADETLNALSKQYGAARARTIMARMVAVATATNATRSTPQSVIGAPVQP